MEVSGQLHAPAALPRGKESLEPFGYEAGWASEPIWMQLCREKFPAPSGTRTPDHPARSPELYRWAIPAPEWSYQTLQSNTRSTDYLKGLLRVSKGVPPNWAPRHEGVLNEGTRTKKRSYEQTKRRTVWRTRRRRNIKVMPDKLKRKKEIYEKKIGKLNQLPIQ
jgi:hypothetical protein